MSIGPNSPEAKDVRPFRLVIGGQLYEGKLISIHTEQDYNSGKNIRVSLELLALPTGAPVREIADTLVAFPEDGEAIVISLRKPEAPPEVRPMNVSIVGAGGGGGGMSKVMMPNSASIAVSGSISIFCPACHAFLGDFTGAYVTRERAAGNKWLCPSCHHGWPV